MKFIYNFVILCGIIVINCEKLPSDINRCRFEDVDCIMKESHRFLKTIALGRSELNIPPIDPFFIKDVTLNLAGGQAIDLKIKFNDVNVIGYSKLIFDKAVGFTSDPATSKYEMYGKVSQLEFKGNYNANGRVLVLPFQGDGKFQMQLMDVKLSLKFKPKVFKKSDGLTYLKVDKIKFFLDPARLHMNFENLFNGNKELGNTMNNLMNENWKELWQEFSPAIFKIAENIVKEILAGVSDRFDFESSYLH